jgi:hypothetical protein
LLENSAEFDTKNILGSHQTARGPDALLQVHDHIENEVVEFELLEIKEVLLLDEASHRFVDDISLV